MSIFDKALPACPRCGRTHWPYCVIVESLPEAADEQPGRDLVQDIVDLDEEELAF